MEGLIIIQDAVLSFIEKIKNAKRIYKLCAFSALALILIVVSVFSSGVKLTYNLIYDGEVFANVSSKAVYEEGKNLAVAAMSGSVKDFSDAELEMVVSINEKTDSAEDVSNLILSKSPEICSGYMISVDNQVVGYISDIDSFNKAKETRLSSFDVDGTECESSFTVDVTASKAYFDTENLTDMADVTSVIETLDVKTVSKTDKVSTVKYETVAKKDSSRYAGYQAVITKGVNGSKRTVTETTYVNGVAVSEPVVTTSVVKTPVNEVILVGTKNVYVTSAPKNASASGFKWPLGVRGVVTSEYGAIRKNGTKMHGGVDIGVPEGTSVIAVKSGTVVEARYDSSYGYYVVIDHGNGLKTRYAHNKRNLVSVGQNVSAGQLIAYSGNTGNSTGPHLHFEVIVNGTKVDPGLYIDLSKCK